MYYKRLGDAYHHGKRMIGQAFHGAVKFAGQLDHAFNVGKRVYGALQPAIQDMGGSSLNRSVMQGFGAYEQGRNQVLGGYNNIQAIQNRIKKAAPELDF